LDAGYDREVDVEDEEGKHLDHAGCNDMLASVVSMRNILKISHECQ